MACNCLAKKVTAACGPLATLLLPFFLTEWSGWGAASRAVLVRPLPPQPHAQPARGQGDLGAGLGRRHRPPPQLKAAAEGRAAAAGSARPRCGPKAATIDVVLRSIVQVKVSPWREGLQHKRGGHMRCVFFKLLAFPQVLTSLFVLQFHPLILFVIVGEWKSCLILRPSEANVS